MASYRVAVGSEHGHGDTSGHGWEGVTGLMVVGPGCSIHRKGLFSQLHARRLYIRLRALLGVDHIAWHRMCGAAAVVDVSRIIESMTCHVGIPIRHSKLALA